MAERSFKIEPLDINRLIEENDLAEVTNPVMFNSGTGATPDGLLSNVIFGITKEERSGIFAYIDLSEYFIHPYFYKIWLKIDKNLNACIYETQNFIIDVDGYLVPNDTGETGIAFLMNNIEKINFKKTKRDMFLQALIKAKKDNMLFINKFIVIPPYYRDVDTKDGGKIGVGELNKFYINLINNVKALKASNDYGLEFTGDIRGRIQKCILDIYNWIALGKVGDEEHTGAGIFKKLGLQRRSGMAKTTDYSARLVLSAPDINVNSQEDLMVDIEYSALPLSACCVLAYPFMIYYLRQYFDNEFGGKIKYPAIDKKGNVLDLTLDNIQLAFSDDVLDKELNEYIHGYSNRIKSIKVPNKEGMDITMRFKGYSITPEEYAKGKREDHGVMIERDITWLDVFYMMASEAVDGKFAVISRYPIDSHMNQLYTKIHINSTIETEPMVINGKLYRWYPKIRQEDIGKDTSNKFIDTCSIANPYCKMMGADYDGDTVTVKMLYTNEANEELEKYTNSPAQFINLSGMNGRVAGNEAIQAMYNLTLALPETKLTEVQF